MSHHALSPDTFDGLVRRMEAFPDVILNEEIRAGILAFGELLGPAFLGEAAAAGLPFQAVVFNRWDVRWLTRIAAIGRWLLRQRRAGRPIQEWLDAFREKDEPNVLAALLPLELAVALESNGPAVVEPDAGGGRHADLRVRAPFELVIECRQLVVWHAWEASWQNRVRLRSRVLDLIQRGHGVLAETTLSVGEVANRIEAIAALAERLSCAGGGTQALDDGVVVRVLPAPGLVEISGTLLESYARDEGPSELARALKRLDEKLARGQALSGGAGAIIAVGLRNSGARLAEDTLTIPKRGALPRFVQGACELLDRHPGHAGALIVAPVAGSLPLVHAQRVLPRCFFSVQEDVGGDPLARWFIPARGRANRLRPSERDWLLGAPFGK